MRTLTVLLLLTSCAPKPIDPDSVDDTPDACSFGVSLIEPVDGAVDEYYRRTVRVTLDEADTDWNVSVLDADGNPVPTAPVESTEDHISLLPELEPNSDYTVQVDYCGGQTTTTFSTSNVGTPIDDTVLDGTVFIIDLDSPTILKPENVDESVLSVFDVFTAAVRLDYSNDIMRMTAALMIDEDTQDVCSRTLTFPFDVAWDNPTLGFGKDRFSFPWEDQEVEINDLAGSATILPDMSGFEGMRVRGWIDVRELNGVIPGFEDAEDDDICELAAGLGLVCEPCGGQEDIPYCITISFEDMEGTVTAATVDDITAEDVSQNTSCP